MTTTPSSTLPTPEVAEQHARIATLQGQLAEQRSRVELFEQGAEIIAQALLDEAVSRDWCSEYGTFVDEVNGKLPAGFPRLRPCEKSYRVSFNVTATEDTMSDLETAIDRILPSGVNTECFEWELSDDW